MAQLALGRRVAAFPPYAPGRFFVRHAIDIVADLSTLEQLTMAGERRARAASPHPVGGTATRNRDASSFDRAVA